MRTPAHILIVDDNPANLKLLQIHLAARGYETFTARDGEEALALARAKQPDLILLDVIMPKVDGIEVCRRLKGDPSLPFMPIILVTAKTDPEDVVNGLEAGAEEYLTQPVEHTALLARVKSMLRIKALHDTTQEQATRLQAQAVQLEELNQSLEARVAEQLKALHQTEKLSALGELLASIAHELNNPLSVVVGQAILLADTATDQRLADRATKIANAADRCARIVKTFLAMARQQPTERKAVHLNDIIDRALDVTRYSLHASAIDVSLQLAQALPPVQGDAAQLHQVLTNLIVNAQHALEDIEGPRTLGLSSAFSAQHEQVVVEVKDNGSGIPPAIRSRIFEPLFTTKAVGTGTGIGLAMCHRIIEAHGGTIEVDTTVNQGATFVIRLPVSVTPGTVSGDVDELHRGAKPLAALIVDDEAEVAELLGDILRADGHRVEIAHSGSAALETIAQRDFDIILSDLRMPGLDGPSLYRVLEERQSALLSRVAFITGDTLSPKIKGFLQTVGRPYIEKPIIPQEVRNLVRLVIESAGIDAVDRSSTG